MALNWLVDNYARIAEWLASAGRVAGLWTAFSDLDASVGTGEEERITIEESTDENIHLDSLAVAQHDGKVMIDEADTTITAGEKVLLMGESGTGKSTLIRAIAGLWPWVRGRCGYRRVRRSRSCRNGLTCRSGLCGRYYPILTLAKLTPIRPYGARSSAAACGD